MERASVRLPTGVLDYCGDPANAIALTSLCDFGARRNPKRGFVFVSKVLGKHWPSSPATMLELHHKLAFQIPQDAEGIVFIGMAETATGLGHGVFEAFLAQSDIPSIYLQTTRYPLAGATAIEFQEEHSHATQQYLYLPEQQEHRDLLSRATVAVLIDDEATSGKTFLNLAHALRASAPRLRTVLPVMLTDFTSGQLVDQLLRIPGIETARSISLWKGSYQFNRDPQFNETPVAPAFAPVSCRRSHISPFTARLGLSDRIELPSMLVDQCQAQCGDADVLVVGTGECMHPAFRLGLALQRNGRDVSVQSTTRSPLMVAGAVADATIVTDPYGEGIPNWLYNLSRSATRQVVVVHESAERGCVIDLVRELGAIEVDLSALMVRPADTFREGH